MEIQNSGERQRAPGDIREREEDIFMSPNNEAKESQGKRKEVNEKLRAEELKNNQIERRRLS
jgi:hypothetical protein